LEKNRLRQIATTEALMAAGWKVVTIWECEVDAGIKALFRKLRYR
jgi:G:T-mismatch repair DNA endonuclease (very short patch repair protein)